MYRLPRDLSSVMVDFVCPECGSIDRVDADVVSYPHQCPGCDRVIEGEPSLVSAWDSDQSSGFPVRVRLLPKELWIAKEPKPRPKPEGRRRTIKLINLVFPAMIVAVIAVGAYVWLEFPEPRDYRRALPSVAAAAQPSRPVEQPKPATPSKAAHNSDRGPEHSARNSPESAPAGEADSTEQNDENTAPESLVEAAPPEPAPAAEAAPTEPRLPAFAQKQVDSHPKSVGEPLSIPRGVTTARPLYSGVPVVSEPSWQAREIVAASSADMLLILDRRAQNQWLHVIHLGSGREGWVRVSQVRITAGGQ
jgi:hypothetical protein